MSTILTNTGITFPDATTQTTAASAGTSYSAGNGLNLSGSTFSVAAPAANSIGSYIPCWMNLSCNQTVTYGSNYAIGTGPNGQIQFAGLSGGSGVQARGTSGISGTWRWMGATFTAGGCGGTAFGIAVRVS